MAVRLSALRSDRPLPPRTHSFWRLSRSQGHSAAGRMRSIEKPNYLIGTWTRDLPACSIVPEPTTLPRAPVLLYCHCYYRKQKCPFFASVATCGTTVMSYKQLHCPDFLRRPRLPVKMVVSKMAAAAIQHAAAVLIVKLASCDVTSSPHGLWPANSTSRQYLADTSWHQDKVFRDSVLNHRTVTRR
jgi:hypothetical protein